jgi:hypothetical protein
MSGLQESGSLNVSDMRSIGQLDSKRVYDVINGLLWAGLISRDAATKEYQYRGVRGGTPIDLRNIAPNIEMLQRQRDEKAEMVRQLRARLDAAAVTRLPEIID